MFSVSNLTVSFDGSDLFKGISFIINQKDRIGLVGKNGVGKSSLLKIIVGRNIPTGGTIDIPSGKKVGYLAQEVHMDTSKTVFEESLEAFSEINQLESDIAELTAALENREDYQSDSYAKLIEDLTEKHEKLGYFDSSKKDSETEKVLKGLGFKPEDFHKKLDQFSGGWQMRVELAKLLLRMPDLLLLDEPTNHLDIESILWLEEFLKSYPGAIVMVSHDKMFLDNITNRTIEIVLGKTYDYKTNYSKFVELRKERIDQQMSAYNNQQKYIEQQERFINRFRAQATKAKAVQSRIKLLDKVDKIEIDDLDENVIRFQFPPAPRSGEMVVRAENLFKSYPDKDVLNNLNFTILRGEKVAFVGQNGMGKTTLVKLINGMPATKGIIELGHNVSIGYYAQIQEKSLNPEKTVLQSIEEIATDEMSKIHRMRALLGAFLFGENDVDKKVKVLSGGEKSRLALARMLLSPTNLIILDEPTNHLDISAKEVLKNALATFGGTIILVSHDREFLQGLTNKTFEFIDGGIKEHFGTIEEFLEKKRLENFREFEQNLKAKSLKATEQSKQAVQKEGPSAAELREKQKEERNLRKEFGRIEQQIEKLESELSSISTEIQKAAENDNFSKQQDLIFKHGQIQKDLDLKMEAWGQLDSRISAL